MSTPASLEDRLCAAIVRRGDITIGRFIEHAAEDWQHIHDPRGDDCPCSLSDADLVLACEFYADHPHADSLSGEP